jgi:hypothetical protein
MLYIKSSVPEDKRRSWEIWHVGDPVPQVIKDMTVRNDKVISLQADGDELLLILSALKSASGDR